MTAAGRDPSRLVPVALVVAVLGISFGAIFFRKAQPTHPLSAAAIRMGLACVLILPVAWRAYLRAGRPVRVLRSGALAGLFYGVHFGAWVTSLGLTSVASSVTLVTATPLLLGVIGVVTGRDAPGRMLWWSLGLALVGLLFIGGGDLALGGDALLGDALALLGAAAMAGYFLVGRRLGEDMVLWPFAAAATGCGALALVGLALVGQVSLAPASTEAFGWLVLAALVPQLVGHSLLTWSLRHTTPTVVGMATVGEPVGSTLLGLLLLGEGVGLWTAIGCAIIIAAVLLALRAQRAASPSSEVGT